MTHEFYLLQHNEDKIILFARSSKGLDTKRSQVRLPRATTDSQQEGIPIEQFPCNVGTQGVVAPISTKTIPRPGPALGVNSQSNCNDRPDSENQLSYSIMCMQGLHWILGNLIQNGIVKNQALGEININQPQNRTN